MADRPPPPPDAPPRDTLRRAAEDVRVALLDAATRFAYSTALPQIKGTPGGEFMGAVLNAADALRSAVAAHPEAPAATPGATSWRCRCGVWNVSPCRACGAGPDERYASRAELDALAAPPDEARGMTPEEREAYRDLKRRVFASAAPGETPCRHEGADPGYNGSAWVLVCRVCGARYVEGEGWRTPGKEDHHG